MKITALVTIELPTSQVPLRPGEPMTSPGVPLQPFVLVYDLFKPEECVAAIARHVTERIPTLGGEPAYFTATRSGRTGEVVLTGSHFNGVEIRVLTRVHTLTRFVRGNACPRCESTALWSAFRTTEADWASIGADAVGCDECGWIASDHPVAGRPRDLGSEVVTAAVLPFRPARSLSAPSSGPSSARVPASVEAKSPAHPALVFCTGCGAHGVRCIAPAGDPGAVAAVSCSSCGLVVSLAELAHAHRFVTTRARLRAVAGR